MNRSLDLSHGQIYRKNQNYGNDLFGRGCEWDGMKYCVLDCLSTIPLGTHDNSGIFMSIFMSYFGVGSENGWQRTYLDKNEKAALRLLPLTLFGVSGDESRQLRRVPANLETQTSQHSHSHTRQLAIEILLLTHPSFIWKFQRERPEPTLKPANFHPFPIQGSYRRHYKCTPRARLLWWLFMIVMSAAARWDDLSGLFSTAAACCRPN